MLMGGFLWGVSFSLDLAWAPHAQSGLELVNGPLWMPTSLVPTKHISGWVVVSSLWSAQRLTDDTDSGGRGQSARPVLQALSHKSL